MQNPALTIRSGNFYRTAAGGRRLNPKTLFGQKVQGDKVAVLCFDAHAEQKLERLPSFSEHNCRNYGKSLAINAGAATSERKIRRPIVTSSAPAA